MKTAYISPTCATLELDLLYTERPEGLVTLDTGIPNWPNWAIRVPLDTDDADTILDMAFQAMAEDFMIFMGSLGCEDSVAQKLFGSILVGFEKIKASPSPEPDGHTAHFRAEIPLDPTFVDEVLDKVVTAKVKRQAPLSKNRRMKVVLEQPDNKALSEAAKVVQRYRTRSLKGQPRPLYILVYNQTGTPVGVQSL